MAAHLLRMRGVRAGTARQPAAQLNVIRPLRFSEILDQR